MAAYTTRTVTYIEHRWELSTPSNGTEISKALHAAQREWHIIKNTPAARDDALTVTTEDDLIVISFTEEDPES
jgi:hypothetical protein